MVRACWRPSPHDETCRRRPTSCTPRRIGLHVLWRVTGFTKESVEALQKQLARELQTDKVATSCAQITRLPGFFNHKYRPAPVVTGGVFGKAQRRFRPSDFPLFVNADRPARRCRSVQPALSTSGQTSMERARRYLAAIPPAVAGNHGDAATFRVCCRLVRGFALERRRTRSTCWPSGIGPVRRRGRRRSFGRSSRGPASTERNQSVASWYITAKQPAQVDTCGVYRA